MLVHRNDESVTRGRDHTSILPIAVEGTKPGLKRLAYSVVSVVDATLREVSEVVLDLWVDGIQRSLVVLRG
jgi:hypothetical protein